jgi:protein-S-isoprenylcysteine O-methyltransferase Ste14
MRVAETWAVLVNKIATGSEKGRIIGTPLALIAFFGLLVLFIYLGIWIDTWLGTPFITGSWRFIAAAVLCIGGLLLVGPTVFQHFMRKGTPVPLNPPQKLITTGLYAHVRNPMAAGAFLLMEAAAFLVGSLSDIILFAPLPLILYVLYIIYVEERELEMRFGQEYIDYKKRVPRFIPRLK